MMNNMTKAENNSGQAMDESVWKDRRNMEKCVLTKCVDGVKLYVFNLASTDKSFVWDGKSKNGFAHGKGVLKFYNGSELVATSQCEFNAGVRVGHGVDSYPDGTTYEGEFIDGAMNGWGRYHSIVSADVIMDGECVFVNNHPHGRCRARRGNRSFDGWMSNRSNYRGIYTYDDGRVTLLDNDKERPLTNEEMGKSVENLFRPRRIDYKPALGKEVKEFLAADGSLCDEKDAVYYRRVTYWAPNRPSGPVREFYMSGQPSKVADILYIDYDDPYLNFYDGTVNHFRENGTRVAKQQFSGNLVDGTQCWFYENGKTAKMVYYSHGRKAGLELVYYESGRLRSFYDHAQGRDQFSVDCVDNEEDGHSYGFLRYEGLLKLDKELSWAEGAIAYIAQDSEHIEVELKPGGIYSLAFASPQSVTPAAFSFKTLRQQPIANNTIIEVGMESDDRKNDVFVCLTQNQCKGYYSLNGEKIDNDDWQACSSANDYFNTLGFDVTRGLSVNDLIVREMSIDASDLSVIRVTLMNVGNEVSRVRLYETKISWFCKNSDAAIKSILGDKYDLFMSRFSTAPDEKSFK